MSYAGQEYRDIDMPQDLSAKYKSVSVQTDKCGENNVEELFEGFSQMQIRTVMDILVQFVKNKDSESIASSVPFVPEYCKNPGQPTNPTRWCTPLSLSSPPTTNHPHCFGFIGSARTVAQNGTLPLPTYLPTHTIRPGNTKSAFHSCTQLTPLHRRKTTQLQLTTVAQQQEAEKQNKWRKPEEREKNIEFVTQSSKKFNDPGVSDESLDAEHHQSRRKTQDGESESSSSSNGRLSRNERLVMDMKIPMTVREIIQNPIEEFNDLLTSKDITEEKINICRDIRRRGKNKIAAQNCRKRKIQQIHVLEEELSLARSEKENILSERVKLLRRRQELVSNMDMLEKDILIKMGREDCVIVQDRNLLLHLKKRDFTGK